MVNVKASTNKNILRLEIDMNQDNGMSKSGKTITIGSTKGNVAVHKHDGKTIFLGLNCYRYPEEKE